MSDSERIARIEEQITALRSDMLKYFTTLNETHNDHSRRITSIEIVAARHDERINTTASDVKVLDGQLRGWNIGNSFAAIIAGIIGWFR